jgi:hypothetical protein
MRSNGQKAEEALDQASERSTLRAYAPLDPGELYIEAALNFATNALSNAAIFWTQCSADQKSTFS